MLVPMQHLSSTVLHTFHLWCNIFRQPCHKELSLLSSLRSTMFILTYLALGKRSKVDKFCSFKSILNELYCSLEIYISFVAGLYLEC